MSTDAAPTPSPTPTPDNFFQRELHALGTRLHDLSVQLAPELKAAEQEALAAAAEAWKMAASGLHDLISRNEDEWKANVQAALTAYLATLAPGVAPEAAAIAAILVNVTFGLIDFAEGKISAQAETPLQPIPPPEPHAVAAMASGPAWK